MTQSGEGKLLHIDANTVLAARVYYHLETRQINMLPKTTGILTVLEGPSDLELQTEFILATKQGRRFRCNVTKNTIKLPSAGYAQIEISVSEIA